MIVLITYDIADDERRGAVAALLSTCGDRVQLSVFECQLDRSAVGRLTASLDRLIESSEDQIRLYPLSERVVRDVTILGTRRLEERQDFWLV